jgi:ribosome biogenesis GTPase A
MLGDFKNNLNTKKTDLLILKTCPYILFLKNCKLRAESKGFVSYSAKNKKIIHLLQIKNIEKNFKTEKKNRRIFKEISQVILSSDIFFLILDIRDPIGTWSNFLSNKIELVEKKVVLILNKIDLVPSWIISLWLKVFSKKYIVVAFHSSNTKPFGKGIVFKIIKHLKKINLSKKKTIIGILGYPNVGKSLFINSLKGKKVTKVNPFSGHTRVWQIIKLSRQVFLIDSPGICYKNSSNKNIQTIRGQINFTKIIKNLEFFIFLVKKIIGNYPENVNFFIHNIDKKGKFNEKKSNSKFASDFLSSKIPWYSPIPSLKSERKTTYLLPWTTNVTL